MSDETQVTPDQTAEDNASVETPAVEEQKVHPAYEKLLAELPEAWHSKITPHLQEQDKYFQQQLERYTPYKEFVEEGISPDMVRGGINLARAIDSDAVGIYTSLQEHLRSQGLLAEEAKQVAKEIMEEESGDDFENIFDGEKVPKAMQKELDTLKAKTEEVENWKNKQEFDREQERYTIELQSEMSELKKQHNINEAHEVAIYDILNNAFSAGREMTVAEAARQLSQMIPGGFAPASAAEPAPTIVGSAGGAGVPAPDLSIPKDDKGKREMLQRMFAERNKQQ
jgi:hypothetical protein